MEESDFDLWRRSTGYWHKIRIHPLFRRFLKYLEFLHRVYASINQTGFDILKLITMFYSLIKSFKSIAMRNIQKRLGCPGLVNVQVAIKLTVEVRQGTNNLCNLNVNKLTCKWNGLFSIKYYADIVESDQ